MSEPYKCGKCGNSSDSYAFAVFTNGDDDTVTVRCQACRVEVSAPSLTEAFQAIAKKEEEAPRG